MGIGELRTHLIAVSAMLLVLGVRSAEACSVCISATEETRQAYYGTTILMMLLPFLLLGALVYWLRRAARAQRASLERQDSLAP